MSAPAWTIYVIRDEEMSPLSYHATKKDAQRDYDWWAREGGIEPMMDTITIAKTREAVVRFLNAFGRDP